MGMFDKSGILAADYTAGGKRRPATLTIYTIANGRRTFIERIDVKGKAAARLHALRLGAEPWNF